MTHLSQHGRKAHAFGTLPVGDSIARALAAMRYHTPTPIQERTIPLLRQGKDVLGQAQTGTGKTAGFGIPLVESIDPRQRAMQALVLVPTRELCLQVADELKRLAEHSGVRILSVYGGVGLRPQIDALSRGVHAVIGTPGRVEDLIQRGALELGGVRFAVLDEADRMLDVGFLPAIERILKRTPLGRQTALFSATMPDEVRSLARRHMRDPITVEVNPERRTVEEIDQRFERVANDDKLSALRAHLDDPSCYLALVFRRTTHKADRLTRDLSRQGYKVAALHGRRSQSQRERVLGELKSGRLQALVATDIAARGLDITGLTHVFNYDLPDTSETYVHRIGRTGRAGERGIAITLIGTEDEKALGELQRYLAGRGDRSSTRPRRPQSPARSRVGDTSRQATSGDGGHGQNRAASGQSARAAQPTSPQGSRSVRPWRHRRPRNSKAARET